MEKVKIVYDEQNVCKNCGTKVFVLEKHKETCVLCRLERKEEYVVPFPIGVQITSTKV